MKPPGRRLPKLLYESLPAIYVTGGLGAVVLSYRRGNGAGSAVLALAGIAMVVGGMAIWLRRRDYRRLRANYRGDSADL